MISINDVKRRLPENALCAFEQQFSPAVFNKLLLAFRAERVSSFRVNTLKAERQDVLRRLRSDSINVQEVGYIPNAFTTDGKNNKQLLNHPLTKNGEIYLQSISSMVPPLLLDPQPGSMVLDIAAAPGSKTSQLAALMKNTGHIDAVEPEFIRIERLRHNLTLLGAEIVETHHTTGQKFTAERLDHYDFVLADVPCSGEGRFSVYDRASYGNWRESEILRFSNLQKKLLSAAIRSAKKNAVIVYSTCTLNCRENEEVVHTVLQEFKGNVTVVPVPQNYKKITDVIPTFKSHAGTVYAVEISGALRVLPSQFTEGFFMCILKKNE